MLLLSPLLLLLLLLLLSLLLLFAFHLALAFQATPSRWWERDLFCTCKIKVLNSLGSFSSTRARARIAFHHYHQRPPETRAPGGRGQLGSERAGAAYMRAVRN